MCCFSYQWGRRRSKKMFGLSESIIWDIWTSFGFSKILITFKTFLLGSFESDWFKCKPLPPKCLRFVLLFTVSSFSWRRCFVSSLAVIWALKSSMRNVGGDISFKRLYRIVCYGKFSTSFVPTCKIMLLGFLWIIGIRLMFHICLYSSCEIAYFNSSVFPAS